jgi:Zn-dependent protease with chaperone function
MAMLNDDELAAVCAHELAHLSEPRWVTAIRLFFSCLARLWVVVPAITLTLHQSYDQDVAASGILATGVGTWVYIVMLAFYGRLYRRMEVRADGAAKSAETAPGTYARALEKIYSANRVPVVITSRKHRYPELYDRLVEAGAPPEYARPAAPPRGPLYLGLITLISGTAAGCVGLDWVAQLVAGM